MSRKLTAVLVAVAACVGAVFVIGCESDAQTGTLIGSLAGAGIGQLAGGDTKSTLIGAGVGGGAGYALGNEQDKKKNKAEIDSLRAEQNVVTVWITNSNGSQTPVRLRKDGPGYIGPRGERYPSIPTQEQLKQLYGM